MSLEKLIAITREMHICIQYYDKRYIAEYNNICSTGKTVREAISNCLDEIEDIMNGAENSVDENKTK